MTQATFDTWLRGSQVVLHENGVVVVAVKDDRARDWLEHRLLDVITRTMCRVAGKELEIRFVANRRLSTQTATV